MSDEEIIIPEAKMKRLKNLKMFKGKTEEDIYEFYRNRDPKPEPPSEETELLPSSESTEVDEDAKYQKKFRNKLKALQTEYGIDMNNSNDADQLKSLVRHLIQQEIVNAQIIRLQRSDEVDTRSLKNLGDYQKTLNTAITEIQGNLNITRKQRKEKQIDDIGQFILDLKKKAKDFYDRKTVPVSCERCGVELARYWLNFPEDTKATHFEFSCPNCSEHVLYSTEKATIAPILYSD